jgi:hypothetical protein
MVEINWHLTRWLLLLKLLVLFCYLLQVTLSALFIRCLRILETVQFRQQNGSIDRVGHSVVMAGRLYRTVRTLHETRAELMVIESGLSSRDDQACLFFFEKQTWQSIWFKLYHLVRAKQPQPPLLPCGYCTVAAPNDVTTELVLTL